jgi:hypothetical protein
MSTVSGWKWTATSGIPRPSLDDDELSDYQLKLKENFASIVGSCIYFSITCRPDLSTIVSKACKGMHGPEAPSGFPQRATGPVSGSILPPLTPEVTPMGLPLFWDLWFLDHGAHSSSLKLSRYKQINKSN